VCCWKSRKRAKPHLQQGYLRNKLYATRCICATFALVLTYPPHRRGFLFCFPPLSLYNAQRLSVEWFQPLICENAITTRFNLTPLRSIPAPPRGLNFSAPHQLSSPILNYVFHHQARLKFPIGVNNAGQIRFFIHHNL
jgi:hypothetical protein